MVTCVADNILSPLGYDSAGNFDAVMAGRTMLRLHEGVFGVPEPFCASLFDRAEVSAMAYDSIDEASRFTFFEQLCILSADMAVRESGLSPDRDDVVFVLSTTKGNVGYLAGSLHDARCFLSESAAKIARYFGNRETPVVVSNACVSGVCAQIAAVRAILSGRYQYAVVIGCDVLSKFIISGFQSFKALSQECCRPYDRDRTGLNLGEAAGTMILGFSDSSDDVVWRYCAASNHNDANHISGPSRTGEGAFRVLSDILSQVDRNEVGFLNAHGTATAYNDEMESIAVHRAGLDGVPVTGLKGYYGHTLGAAGVIETILSMKAIDHGVVLPTRGYAAPGTTYKPDVSPDVRFTGRAGFIKILSGFGGSNAGIAYRKGGRS